MKWYAIHTYSGHENKVKSNLEKAINTSGLTERFGRVLVPTQLVTEMKNGKKTQSTRKYFPSYIIIEMELDEDTWHVVRNCPGVSRFVGATASKPDALREAEVNRILGQIEGTKDKAIPEVPFHEGEHVKVIDGPFSDFTGVVDEVNPERGKLKVMVSIFGRATPVELDFLQVQSV
ncbi:MAG: transcription termination/antitermination protein NusG [Candidatus Eiseniibacteriota bacterium]